MSCIPPDCTRSFHNVNADLLTPSAGIYLHKHILANIPIVNISYKCSCLLNLSLYSCANEIKEFSVLYLTCHQNLTKLGSIVLLSFSEKYNIFSFDMYL